MVNHRHSLFINFLGAAGEVTPSSSLVTSLHRVSQKVVTETNILVDAGSAIREETIDGKNARTISTPKNVDAVLLTHSHTDHVGDLPVVIQNNPRASVYSALGNKEVQRIMIKEAYVRQQDREYVSELEEWRRDMTLLIGKMEGLEEQLEGGIKRDRNRNRNKTTLQHEVDIANQLKLEAQLVEVEARIWYELGLTDSSIIELFALLDRDITDNSRYDISGKDFREAVNKKYQQKLLKLSERGIVTPGDVELAISKITELSLNTKHAVAKITGIPTLSRKSIKATFQNSGHTITAPATQIRLEIPTAGGEVITVLFSGDRGNSQLQYPYAQADDENLEDCADALVMESTYGDRIHGDREKELEKLDNIVLDAIKRKEDIIIPVISLDRPIVLMFEIVMRLLKTGKIKPAEIDFCYFGGMIARLLPRARNTPMMKELIKEMRKLGIKWRELKHDEIKSFRSSGKKSRFVLAGGGFVPMKGSPAGAIMEYALRQDELTILSANFHGEAGSNGHNLFNGKGFQLTKENPGLHMLSAKQKTHYIHGFSGHEDGPGLVKYARSVVKKGGTIFLNHGSEKSRQALKNLLERDPIIIEKGITVVLPRPDKDYVIKKASRRKK